MGPAVVSGAIAHDPVFPLTAADADRPARRHQPVLHLLRNVGSNALDRVSDDVFWLHRGRLHPLRAEVRDGRLEQLYPPDEFMQLVERLPRG